MYRIPVLLVLSVALCAGALHAADTTPAIVTGAELLYVRRGPGTNFPAFATIDRGERVEVEALDGVWAQVRLASGQTGYVHSTFLSFPGERHSTVVVPATVAVTPTSPPTEEATTSAASATPTTAAPTLATRTHAPTRVTPPRAASPTPTSTPQPTPVASSPTPTPSEEVRGAIGNVASTPERSESPAAKDSDSELAALRIEVQRLTAAADSLQHRLEETSLGDAAVDSDTEHSWRSPLMGLLVIFALLVGWVAGSAYGRQRERTRRGRIRF
ncbi:MAG: SH3 domain-containing protein [Deltaproteobacteria bacterium]|nr:SH3 domain-containing protein [Deltaproteobacteria bacterium]MBI3386409.1 SH3 domain-containing protein [Deltaproteobacteria bacterium]